MNKGQSLLAKLTAGLVLMIRSAMLLLILKENRIDGRHGRSPLKSAWMKVCRTRALWKPSPGA